MPDLLARVAIVATHYFSPVNKAGLYSIVDVWQSFMQKNLFYSALSSLHKNRLISLRFYRQVQTDPIER